MGFERQLALALQRYITGVRYDKQKFIAPGPSLYLEYYETWKEEEFPDKYSGSSSLGRIE